MLEISDKIRGPTAGRGDGWKVYRRVRAPEAQGKPVVDLTVGECANRPTPAPVRRTSQPLAVPGMAARTLPFGSMSKSRASSRIGWRIVPGAAIAQVSDLATQTTCGVAGFIQDAALHALRLGAVFEARIAAPFATAATPALRRWRERRRRHFFVRGTYPMLDICGTGMSCTDFALQLPEARHIVAVPGESFGRAATGHLRLALGPPDAEPAAALDTIIAFAKEQTP